MRSSAWKPGESTRIFAAAHAAQVVEHQRRRDFHQLRFEFRDLLVVAHVQLQVPAERRHFRRQDVDELGAAVALDVGGEPRAAHAARVEAREFFLRDVGTHAGDAARAMLAEFGDDVERERVVESVDARVDLHRALQYRVAHAEVAGQRQIGRRVAAVLGQRIFLRVFEHVAMTIGAAGGQRVARLARIADARLGLMHGWEPLRKKEAATGW